MTKLKIVVSWLAVVTGCLIGFVGSAQFGMSWVSFSADSGWYPGTFGVVGMGMLGAVHLIGSLVAVRNRDGRASSSWQRRRLRRSASHIRTSAYS